MAVDSARAFIAECSIDDNEVRRRLYWKNLSGRDDAYEKPAARCKQLFCVWSRLCRPNRHKGLPIVLISEICILDPDGIFMPFITKGTNAVSSVAQLKARPTPNSMAVRCALPAMRDSGNSRFSG
jgi:hypothetical protein